MNHDPLYRKIAEALARPLVGTVFQQCAVALIGKERPDLAPCPGGNDAGMDGAFETPDGPFPLICTVEADVIGNLRKNVLTYLAKRTGPKRAAVATSQLLSNAKKRNLEDAAKDLGIVITNIYDATYFTERLYRDSKWRLELLGVTGDPPALSALPRRGRFVKPEILVGRDADLIWLTETQSDKLLVGQPGSGKTYLHQKLASQKLCLFAVDDSLQRLADAIREQCPSIIVIDDAHFHLELVQELKRLRAELGATYHIHANCWPRHEDAVQRVLGLPNGHVRRLHPLKRQEIFELVKRMGVNGPDWLQHLLISQSDGKPGLAVSLAELCKIENASTIWSGEVVARELLGNLRLVSSERERCVLAAFAVGGDVGMSFGSVSKALGLSPLELRQITADLGSGGLVEEVADDRLQVRPPAIRAVLVRDVFYGGPTSQPITHLLIDAISAASTATVLLSARQRGAAINQELLETFVTAADTTDVWEHFGWVDARCSGAILDKYPDKVCFAAAGLLNDHPRRALHALLDADENKAVKNASAVEHPRRQIGEWLFPFEQPPALTMERRNILLSVLEERVSQAKVGNGGTFAWGLAEILQVCFDVVKPSPGDRFQLNCIRGVASHTTFSEIAGLWPRIHSLTKYVPNTAIRPLFDRIEDWCLPQRFSLAAPLADETYRLAQASGKAMLIDLLKMPRCNRAWKTQIATIVRWAKFDFVVEPDEAFEALYAHRDHTVNWQEEEKRRHGALERIGAKLGDRPMQDVLQYLFAIRSEASEFGYPNSNGHLSVLCYQIAQSCDDVKEWVAALVEKNAPMEFLAPFVERLSREDYTDFESTLGRLIVLEPYRSNALNWIIRLSAPNETLLESALNLLNGASLDEYSWFNWTDISLPIMFRLLSHSNAGVRGVAAMGEWCAEPMGSVRVGLESQWRLAVRDVDVGHYALKEIFGKDSSLAFEWLQHQIRLSRLRFAEHHEALHSAANALSREQRLQLLLLFTRKNYDDDCFDIIMDDQTDLFRQWLLHQEDNYLRLRPMNRDADTRWEQMALLALDAGVTPEELAHHCMPKHWGGTGPLSQHFLSRIPIYEALSMHSDIRLRPAGKYGLEYIRANAENELDTERREAVYGE